MSQVTEQSASQPVPTPDPAPGKRGLLERFRRDRLLARVSIQSKLILMLVLCTMLAAAVVGAIAFEVGRTSLRTAVFSRLIEIREAQSRALEGQFGDLKNSLVIYSHGTSTSDALAAFTAGFNQLDNVAISPAQWQGVLAYYDTFIKQTEQQSGTQLDAAALLPTAPAQRYLQANYTARLPTDDAAIAMGDAGDGSQWSAANARYQDFFRQIATRFGFQDALLLDARGNVVYSAYKGVDLGTNIITGPYAGSKLHAAYLKAMSANTVDYVGLTDFEFYQPAQMQPTAWMVAPIAPNGRTEGVLALQFPISKINQLMTFDRQWKDAGLGATGETFLVGPDGLMRSDSRVFVEDPQRYKREVTAAGTPAEVADKAILLGGTTLVQPDVSQATSNARRGETGTLVSSDYLGNRALQSYAPLPDHNSGLQWSIIAKVDVAEAFAKESSFTRTMVLSTVGMIFIVCVLAAYLAQVFVRPIRRLEAGAQRIAAGDYLVAIPVETRDELGDLTQAFNDMSRSLTVKDDLLKEQRQQNDELLRSLMPDAVVERFRQGEETIASEHHNVTVIFADLLGIDRLQAEMSPGDYLALGNELMRQIEAAATDLGIESVHTVRNGYLASCGLTVPRLDNVRRTVDFAVECVRIVERFNSDAGIALQLRAGIDSGDVGSGLMGSPSLVYDMWGDAVNLAHQVKDGSPRPGIFVTAKVYEALRDTMTFVEAGSVTVGDTAQPIWQVSEDQR
ncbi:adenylate/guanylate cyclase domain-containing protein [Mycolicibacterium aichiense]|uniref:Adenylate/guanylate cyclase domain-containing protein n=1 Tax=Mycolicibacterium aichiense TaxID=1799 RepID=A0AAD1MD39_9MYCO|nr:adenylate/guanylate cyclase domain-containing protein [Mycolicibacterium aichiense]MCV7020383.1 HAMP domain-containing protein [Mycolicibacterium aichiense]BBX07894.1 adenylate/guanylate cyclase domain-containing protein [Mycolicibacterium aichiense]STZ81704.1 family 3 adenylate cyclase [Mycolicibacterium aichiense]